MLSLVPNFRVDMYSRKQVFTILVVCLISAGIACRTGTVLNGRNSAPEEDLPQCIQTLEDLKNWFRYSVRQPLSQPRRNSLLDLSIRNIQEQSSVIVRYLITTSSCNSSSVGNCSARFLHTDSLQSSTCCNPKQTKGCFVISASRKPILRVMPSDLVFLLGSGQIFVHKQLSNRVSQAIYCWNVPVPFCPFVGGLPILLDFTNQILMNEHILESGVSAGQSYYREPVTIKLLRDDNWLLPFPSRSQYYCDKIIVPYVAFLTFSLMATPLAVWVVLRTHKYFSIVTTLEHTKQKDVRQVAVTFTIAFLVSCWIAFGLLYCGHYRILVKYSDFETNRQNDLPELFRRCTDTGFYMLYTYAALTVVEMPFIVMYISNFTKEAVSGSKKTKIAVWFRHTIASLGWSGMVFLQKIVTGYLVYGALLSSIHPLYTIAMWGQSVAVLLVVILVLSTLLHCFIHHKKLQIKSFFYLLYATLVAINLNCPIVFLWDLSNGSWSSFNTNTIMSTLFSTVILSSIGYGVKKVLFYEPAVTNSEKEMHMVAENKNPDSNNYVPFNSLDNKNAVKEDEKYTLESEFEDDPMLDVRMYTP